MSTSSVGPHYRGLSENSLACFSSIKLSPLAEACPFDRDMSYPLTASPTPPTLMRDERAGEVVSIPVRFADEEEYVLNKRWLIGMKCNSFPSLGNMSWSRIVVVANLAKRMIQYLDRNNILL